LKNLSEIRDSLGAIESLENKISVLNKRLKFAENDVFSLLEKYEKECFDVQRIQKENISSFLLKVFGKFESRLEKEKQEEIKAKINYDRALVNLEEIKQEKQELEERLTSLHSLSLKYESELKKRRNLIQQKLSKPNGQQYTRYEKEIEKAFSQITEIEEALRAADNVKQTAYQAAESLKSAESWATCDIWIGGGIITHSIKYSHIDKAEDCFNRLTSQIETLCAELKDVSELEIEDFTQITSTQRAIDFWFDNIFTDFSVRSQIRENMNRVDLLINQVDEIKNMLNGKLEELNQQTDNVKRRQEDLLISLEIFS
jgi:hypothetical protein